MTNDIFCLQKANILKRISAFILDLILLVIIAVGCAYLLSLITGFDGYNAKLEAFYGDYESKYGVEFDITEEEYLKLDEEKRQNYDNAYKALSEDSEAVECYNIVLNLTMLITSLCLFFAFVLLEFVVPIIFKNGRTVGKKLFGIGVMRTNGVKINAIALFVRAILGKYTLETMIPVFIVIFLYFNMTGLVGSVVLILIGAAQLILLCATKTNSLIHDLISDSVVIDMASQRIFGSEDELTDYKNKLHAEKVVGDRY